MPDSQPIPRRIGNWWLRARLGSGYSGSIFSATNVHTGQMVALKIQRVDHECPTNRYERAFYPALQGGVGMPTLWATGVAKQWDYLAIDLLGPSLDNLYRQRGGAAMDLRSVCCIAMQLISRLEFMHSRGILHRDIQLGNCVLGLPPNERTIYMIDFGFSKCYIDAYTKRHIPDSKAERMFVGNFWFSSVRVHCRGRVPSRRDDLESAALMLIHLLTPHGLPWTRNGVPKTDAAHDQIQRAKRNARPEDLCRGLPPEFEEFLRYCRRLKFQDRPDYASWHEHFRELAVGEGFPASDEFIWPPPEAPTPRAMKLAKRTVTTDEIEVANALQDLAKLQLGDRRILGDRKNLVSTEKIVDEKQNTLQRIDESKEIVEISSGSEGTIAPRTTTRKAERLLRLTKAVSATTDKVALSGIVTEFIAVLQSNSSRSLTKEGFAFLDTLQKKLGDASVFHHRTLRPRGPNKEQVPKRGSRHVKLGIVARLARDVEEATGKEGLGRMVADFLAVTSECSGHTITKDGFGFLSGLAVRLRDLHDM